MYFFNRCFDKNRLKALILWLLNNSDEDTTLDVVEKLKDLGFQYATKAGLSLSIDDLKSLQSDANVPKRSRRRQKSDKNTVSLDF
jgi:DNA-directed RNA polymerase beta' subunit